LICATNVNVETAMQEGKLREDLYFRINTVTLAIPPLRDRPEDVPLLAEHFLQTFRSRHSRSIDAINPDAMRVLMRYRWPGNVRELEHVIERAVIVTEGPQVVVDDLSPVIKTADRQPSSSTFTIPPHHTLAEIEKLAILQTLERTSWNKRKAAHILGVYRPTLYSKLRKYHLTEGPNGGGIRPGVQKKAAAAAPPAQPPVEEPQAPR
jgi:transcriptional regulator with PAS, ATPase and Fis domain